MGAKPKVVEFADGIAILGSFPDKAVMELAYAYSDKKWPLVIADPPYGNIVGDAWDKVIETDVAYAKRMVSWAALLAEDCLPGAALYVWGGVGLPRRKRKSGKVEDPPFRPFYRFLLDVELETKWRCSTPITWKKRRAYGIQWGFLFCREEVAYLTLGDVREPHRFNVPLLETKRGYAGYDLEHPAKSEFFRRTNVWTDVEREIDEDIAAANDESLPGPERDAAARAACERIGMFSEEVRSDVWDDVTEILRGKVHEAEKPRRLMEIPIEIHTERGEVVFDPFAGSGTTAQAARHLGRRFVVVERDPEIFEGMASRLR